MRKQLLVEDAAMILQWVAVVTIAPFVLLPLYSARQPVGFRVRLLLVLGAVAVSAIATLVYLHERKRSKYEAARVANIMAVLDAALVTTALFIWPEYLPDLFWVFPLLVVATGMRMDYKKTVAVTVGLCALYAATIISRLGTAPTRVVVGDTVVRIVFLGMIALITIYMTRRESLQRRDARILSLTAVAINSTLDVDELLDIAVEAISEAAEMGRCSAFLLAGDGKRALPKSTTEKDPSLREEFFNKEIDLTRENAATRVVREGTPLVLTDVEGSGLLDQKWISQFGVNALLVLPILIRDEARGIVFVERRTRKGYFLEREVQMCSSILAQMSAGLENSLRYEEEHKRRSEADELYRASRVLGSTLEVGQVTEKACTLAMESVVASTCTAFLADEDRRMLQPRVSVTSGDVIRREFPAGSEVPAADVERIHSRSEKQPAMLLDHPEQMRLLPAFLRSEGTVLIAPLISHGRIGGMLCLSDPEEREFSVEQLSRLSAIAAEAALAVLNAQLHERIKSDATQLSSLIQLTNAIGSTADLTTVMRIALDTVRHMFECNSGLIYRIDEAEGTLVYVDSFGYSEEVIQRISSPPRTSVGECWTVAEGRLICIDDLAEMGLSCETLEKIGQGSSMCVGMQVEDKTLGVLHVRSEKTGAFAEEDQQLALAIADQVALALQRAILFEEINRLAITDPLTGVFNVRRMEEVLRDELSRARRYARPISFVMVDVDNLKDYNDNLGHQKGDVVLSQVASIVDSSTREVDKVFRYGGDEFCIVLPETDCAEALVVAEKVRRAVSDFHFSGEERIPGGSLTVSVGVATFPDDAGSREDLVRNADAALYAAKQRGRNTVAT